MPGAIVALLLGLGCQATLIQAPSGPAALVLICPPPVAMPSEPAPEERQG
mgnify:CR=1 FL=1